MSELLEPGGLLVVGTTAGVRGGPTDQDLAASTTALSLSNRFSDWHLTPFDTDSSWSVSVYAKPGILETHAHPDGIFILNAPAKKTDASDSDVSKNWSLAER